MRWTIEFKKDSKAIGTSEQQHHHQAIYLHHRNGEQLQQDPDVLFPERHLGLFG
jgi:hypothetical protein